MASMQDLQEARRKKPQLRRNSLRILNCWLGFASSYSSLTCSRGSPTAQSGFWLLGKALMELQMTSLLKLAAEFRSRMQL